MEILLTKNKTFSKTKIKSLFDLLEKKIQKKMEIGVFYNCPFNLYLKNEHGEPVKVLRLIKKISTTTEIHFSNKSYLKVGSDHLFIDIPAKTLKVGDTIKTLSGNTSVISIINNDNPSLVYDMEVDSESHLYCTPDGIIHHNSGKSLILTKLAGENIKRGGISYIIDTEDAVNPLFAKVILNDPDGKIVNRIQRVDTIDTLEQLRNFVVTLANKKIATKNMTPIFIGIDSISQLSSEKEMEDAKSGSFARDMTKQQAMRGFFRVVNRLLRSANITLIVLSHTSAAIGAFGNPVTAANHGGGVKFASSVRIWITSSKEVSDSSGIPLGVRMNFKIEKNRLVFKGRKASVNLSFKKGIQPWSGLLELLADNSIVKLSTKDIKKTTTVVYKGEEFKASKIEEWVEASGGKEAVLQRFQNDLDAIYGHMDVEETFEELDIAEEDLPLEPILE